MIDFQGMSSLSLEENIDKLILFFEHLNFNDICLIENLLPKYRDMDVHIKTLNKIHKYSVQMLNEMDTNLEEIPP